MNLNSKYHVWRKAGSAHHMQSTIPKVKCAGYSLMLWGCFSAAGTEGLIRVEEKLNAPKYRDSLNENPVQSIQHLRLGRRFTFQQDNVLMSKACCIKQKRLEAVMVLQLNI